MKDPYEVLGVSPDATEDPIKEAYRALARKYHPDNYADNPLSDLANEKMQEINDAYDAIKKLEVRGAPAIGIFAGYTMYMLSLKDASASYDEFLNNFKRIKSI